MSVIICTQSLKCWTTSYFKTSCGPSRVKCRSRFSSAGLRCIHAIRILEFGEQKFLQILWPFAFFCRKEVNLIVEIQFLKVNEGVKVRRAVYLRSHKLWRIKVFNLAPATFQQQSRQFQSQLEDSRAPLVSPSALIVMNPSNPFQSRYMYVFVWVHKLLNHEAREPPRATQVPQAQKV